MKNKMLIIIAAVVVLAIIGGGAAYYFYFGSPGGSDYVATVSGEKITKWEYQFFLESVKKQMENGIQDEATKNAMWSSKIGGQNAQDAAKDRALESAKEFKIQLAKAKEANITLAKEDTDKVDSLMKQVLANGKAEADKMLIQNYGVDSDQYKTLAGQFLIISKLAQAEGKKITTTDADLKKYYDENNTKSGKVTVRHILISTMDKDQKPLPEDKQKEAQKKAEDVLAKVKAGEDFAALAKQYSEDPGSKDNGGEYTFGKGEMVKEFEDWAFSAKDGDSGIVKTSYGYHVMYKPTFDQIKKNVQSEFASSKYMELLEKWKKEPQYNLVKNQKVLDSIPVLQPKTSK